MSVSKEGIYYGLTMAGQTVLYVDGIETASFGNPLQHHIVGMKAALRYMTAVGLMPDWP
jgi:hypothetical protein